MRTLHNILLLAMHISAWTGMVSKLLTGQKEAICHCCNWRWWLEACAWAISQNHLPRSSSLSSTGPSSGGKQQLQGVLYSAGVLWQTLCQPHPQSQDGIQCISLHQGHCQPGWYPTSDGLNRPVRVDCKRHNAIVPVCYPGTSTASGSVTDQRWLA